MKRLTDWIARCSADWRLIVGVLLCQSLLLVAMLQIGKPFQRATGFAPFDFQTELTSSDMAAQLATYTTVARQLYYGMSVIDFVFPVLGGVAWALLIGAGLRLGWPEFWQRQANKHFLALPFVGTLCDWMENIGNLRVIAAYPPFDGAAAAFAVAAKQAKLVCVSLAGILAIALLCVGAARHWAKRRSAA